MFVGLVIYVAIVVCEFNVISITIKFFSIDPIPGSVSLLFLISPWLLIFCCMELFESSFEVCSVLDLFFLFTFPSSLNRFCKTHVNWAVSWEVWVLLVFFFFFSHSLCLLMLSIHKVMSICNYSKVFFFNFSMVLMLSMIIMEADD